MTREEHRRRLLEEREYLHQEIIENLLLSILQKLPRPDTAVDPDLAKEFLELQDERRALDQELKQLDTSD